MQLYPFPHVITVNSKFPKPDDSADIDEVRRQRRCQANDLLILAISALLKRGHMITSISLRNKGLVVGENRYYYEDQWAIATLELPEDCRDYGVVLTPDAPIKTEQLQHPLKLRDKYIFTHMTDNGKSMEHITDELIAQGETVKN